jgi:hypothetical protein
MYVFTLRQSYAGDQESSGRGGAGNIFEASQSDDQPIDGPDDFSVTRGREPIPSTLFPRRKLE